MTKYIDRLDASTIPVLPVEQRTPFQDTDEAFEAGWRQALEMVAMMDPADVVERKTGKWALVEKRRKASVYRCSECGNFFTVWPDTLNGGRGDMNYCPNCGAKMDGGLN